ncbi:MAG: sigma 54-interacting transcriptional regulator [Clostridia bacterium]|nr:sigma 54-interacting transcriptional regulator [Clostridia bacterium]
MAAIDNDKLIEALRDYYRESIFVTDGSGTVVFANEVASQRVGLPLDELIGRNAQDMVSEGVYSYSTVMESIRTKREVAAEINSSDDLHTFSNSVPVMDKNGRVELVVTNNMSIEHSKEWEEIIGREKQKTDMLKRELDYLRLRDKRVIIANSKEMKDILNSVNTIASSDANIVILGESGTGKDMIAQIIHEQSWRSNESFISVNCAAMPENLLESELFGYEGGAFTGALSKGKIGLFEAASGGTLFLDEIGEMSPALQSKLLRVIENHEIRRVGGVENIPVDVRIICATNSNLEEMIQAKTFREDLYYRLAVFTLKLPRLSERPDDIIPIAELFLRELNEKYNTHKHFSDITIETMRNYSWPGNIRELRNVVERIFVVSRGDELVFTPVPTASYGQYFSEMPNPLMVNDGMTLREFTDSVESQYITKVLDECGGVVTEAAKRLGVHRSVIYRKLNKTGTEIEREI